MTGLAPLSSHTLSLGYGGVLKAYMASCLCSLRCRLACVAWAGMARRWVTPRPDAGGSSERAFIAEVRPSGEEYLVTLASGKLPFPFVARDGVVDFGKAMCGWRFKVLEAHLATALPLAVHTLI